jgi:hypothetical protein
MVISTNAAVPYNMVVQAVQAALPTVCRVLVLVLSVQAARAAWWLRIYPMVVPQLVLGTHQYPRLPTHQQPKHWYLKQLLTQCQQILRKRTTKLYWV